MSLPAARCQSTTDVVERAIPGRRRLLGSAGSSMSRRPSATRTSLAWTIPAMPSLIVRRYWISASTNARGSNVAPRAPYRIPGMTSCGCVCTTWYISWNACWASFQFTGRRHAYHHSVRSDSTFHASRMVAAGSMHCRNGGASSSRLIHAHAPHSSHRTGVRSTSSGCRLCSAERLALRDVRVRAVLAVAPPVERAGEPALAGPPTLHDLDATMAAGVLERPHLHVIGAQHDDRLIEDLVGDVVARLGDLLEPARHLPDAGPQHARLPARRSPGRSSAPWGPGREPRSHTAPEVPTTSDPRRAPSGSRPS